MTTSLLPPNATPGERALEGTVARISNVPTPARAMWNADTCPAALLPWMAWAFSVDNWDDAWTESQRRAAISAAFEIQRRKGTIGAVRRAVASLGLGLQVIEWFEDTPAGDPYTFRVALDVNQDGASQVSLEKMLAVVDAAKNLRSHMASIDLTVTSDSVITMAAVTLTGHDITVEAWIPSEAELLTFEGFALATEDGLTLITE